jgi:Zinc dependent phospholipase C
MRSRVQRGIVAVALCLLIPRAAYPYSFQTHEQLIDLTWTDTIEPLLKRRFANISKADLLVAHGYAYGGSAIQDLGYYPFANEFFSDLTHYVRSADFVQSLFRHAQNANELAFAIGALSHYIGDTIGHSDAINPAVAIEFPGLRKKFGPSVTYAENHHAHVRTEFAFDVDEAGKRHLAPSAYLRHAGLRIPYRLLAESFVETYGLELRPILGKRRPVIRGYRFAVRSLLPRVAYAEVLLHRAGFPPEPTTSAAKTFRAQLDRTEFAIGWNQFRKQPGIGTYLLAGLIAILPKVGKLSELAIRGPESSTLERYIESVDRSTSFMRDVLGRVEGDLQLPNRDLDTGDRVKRGVYPLTDETYAKLLHKLTTSPHGEIQAALKQNILDYYADPGAPITSRKNGQQWGRVRKDLALLGSLRPAR